MYEMINHVGLCAGQLSPSSVPLEAPALMCLLRLDFAAIGTVDARVASNEGESRQLGKSVPDLERWIARNLRA